MRLVWQGIRSETGIAQDHEKPALTKHIIPFGSSPEICPVRAVHGWLAASGIEDGPLFRAVNRHGHVMEMHLSDRAVAEGVKRSLRWRWLIASIGPWTGTHRFVDDKVTR